MLDKLKKNRKKVTYFSWTVIPCALYLVFFIIPVLLGINYSLTDWNGLSQTYNYVGLKNFVSLFTDSRILNSMLFTAKYTVILVVIVMILAMAFTLMLTYVVAEKLKTFFRSVLFFPSVLALITVGLVWNQIMYRVLPQVGEALHIGWLSQNLLGNPDTAIWGVLLVNIWQGVAIPFVILLAGIQNVPTDMYEAATIDGANAWETFTHITIPFMMPQINVAFVLVLKSGITVFDYIQAMTAGGPMRTTESAGYLIYEMAFKDSKAGQASAYALVLLIVVAVISFAQQKFSERIEVGQV